MAGRKRKPTHLKVITGNPGRRQLNRAEPMPRGRLEMAPDWMTEGQKASWNYAIAHAPLGLLKRLDRGVLTVWVVAEALHRDAAMKIAEFGPIVKSPKAGEPMQSPYVAIQNRQAQVMLRAAAELGFTPAGRSRIEIEYGEGDGEEEEEFFGS